MNKKHKNYLWLVAYDCERKPYFVTVYTKKELKSLKKQLKDRETYKILKKEPFIGW